MSFHLNPLKYKIIGELTFILKSPLNIGSGGQESIREYLRLPDGRLIIPSTTWKGAFRYLSELIARAASFNGYAGLAVKSYTEKKSGVKYSGELFEKYLTNFYEWLKSNDEKVYSVLRELGYKEKDIQDALKKFMENYLKPLRKMAEEYLATYCPIGKLYGNSVLAGKIRFLDTFIDSVTEYKPGVGIDRMTGKAKEGVLYRINVISPGLEVKLRLIVDNLIPGEDDSKLFASTLELIKSLDLSIGSRKSIGLGLLGLKEGIFYVIDMQKDENYAIGNPFKKAQEVNLLEFIKWLQG